MVTAERVAAALPAYEVGAEIGRGACGVVLAGVHRRLRREVAIKVLAEQFVDTPAVRSRFVTEARVLAGFDHPHIVPVYDYVEDEGLCALVMERLGGGTVWRRFRDGRLTQQTSVALVLAAAASLDYAHSRGVLHRDVKPENLLFSAADVVKVTDFGIAKVLGAEMTFATRVGDTIGTPAYMAPEQARGDTVDAATDIYALGTVLYELLCGELPFEPAETAIATLYRRVHEDPRPLTGRSAQVPGDLAAVVMRALAREPGRRTRSAAAFAAELAAAASRAWGPDWPEASGVAVAPGTIRAAPVTGAGAGGTTIAVPAVGAGSPAELATSVPITPSAPAARATGGIAAIPAAAGRRLGSRRARLLAGGAGIAAVGVVVAAVLIVHGRSGSSPGGFRAGSTVAVGSAVQVSSVAPCPALPAGWSNQNAIVYLTDPNATNPDGSRGVDLTAVYIPTQADGSWSGGLLVPTGTAPGSYVVRVRCVGDDAGHSTNTLSEYPDRPAIEVTR